MKREETVRSEMDGHNAKRVIMYEFSITSTAIISYRV